VNGKWLSMETSPPGLRLCIDSVTRLGAAPEKYPALMAIAASFQGGSPRRRSYSGQNQADFRRLHVSVRTEST